MQQLQVGPKIMVIYDIIETITNMNSYNTYKQAYRCFMFKEPYTQQQRTKILQNCVGAPSLKIAKCSSKYILNVLKTTSQKNENEKNNRMMSIEDHYNMKLVNYDNENNKQVSKNKNINIIIQIINIHILILS